MKLGPSSTWKLLRTKLFAQRGAALGVTLTCGLASLVFWVSGCAMCCGPYDNHYSTYGGAVQRTDPVYGRVGSIFSDPYKAGSGPAANSNLKAAPQETPRKMQPAQPRPDDNLDTSAPVDRETSEGWQGRPRNDSGSQWR